MKKLLPILLIFSILSACVLGAVTLTLPLANADLTRGSAYTYTATTDSDYDNCTFAYAHRGDSAYTAIGTNVSVNQSSPTIVSTIPDQFGQFIFRANCTTNANAVNGDDSTGTSVMAYGSDEAPEPVIDIVVGVLDALFDFVAVIGMILLIGYAVKRYKKSGVKVK